MHLQPCLLCWYQRILMYPLTVLLTVGIVRRDRGVYTYVLPLSITGVGVSLYHYLLIKTDWLPVPPCTSGIPCTIDYINWFGFVNIPLLALIAFVIITGAMWAFASADHTDTVETTSHRNRANLGVIAIIGSVLAAYMLGSLAF